MQNKCFIDLILLLITSLPLLKLPAAESAGLNGAALPRATNYKQPTCGYASCPTTHPDKINVHIVAHTHDDVGWLKTVDQYYYGTNKRFSPVGVQHILDSLMPQLVMDKTKRFVYVEMSFFSKWWEEQDEQMRSTVRQLVNEGRLEFINGGWCMNDEATVNYQSTIEQMTLGLRFLNETFGSCARPKVGWQIDPFGHSNEQASLFAQFGFDGMFFTRIGYLDKMQRTQNKSLDIIWHGDRALSGQSGSIFTNIFRDGYDSPSGFCFDVLCYDDNLVDNKKSYEYNVDHKGKMFIQYLREYAKSKLTNHLLIPIGGDFQYSAAGQNFKNSDKLIKYVRAMAPDLNIFYSTPSCYQYSLHQTTNELGIRLPEKFDDFMPYDSSASVWWSGYFSSRPSVKLVERETANLLQVVRMVSLANLIKSQTSNKTNDANKRNWTDEVKEHEAKCLMPLWEILGDLQHHDAVTGTEKQHVNDDYVRRASDAADLCAKFIGDLRRSKLNEYLSRSQKYEQLRETNKRFAHLNPIYLEETMFCPLLNISECDPIESEVDIKKFQITNTQAINITDAAAKQQSQRHRRSLKGNADELSTKATLVNVYNPLAKPFTQHDIRLPCNGRCDLDKVRVIHISTNETMKLIRLPIPSGVATLPFRNAITNYEILFYANIPALGYTSFVVEDTNNEETVDEENDEINDSIVANDDQQIDANKSTTRSRRIRRADKETGFEYFTINLNANSHTSESRLHKRDSSLSQQNPTDRIIVKFDLSTGMIGGLRRARDGSFLNITQKFGYYYPVTHGPQPGAYIFRPNTTEPYLLDKPIKYKMFKRKSGALIEIHQKWADWLWQTIRVDAKKNYIEFDYVIGPVPIEWTDSGRVGREVVTRYITNMANNGVFLTDSNGRQLLTRHTTKVERPDELGGSFYPVVSTILLRNTGNLPAKVPSNKLSAEIVAILVDRAQAGASLNEGQLELLIHRRHLRDDNFGVAEALDEPGEDGRGLVVRGKHRLYLKFQDQPENHAAATLINRSAAIKRVKPQLFKLPDTPKANLSFEEDLYNYKVSIKRSKQAAVFAAPTYIVHDQVLNDLKQESRKQALKPILTFDRIRIGATEFMDMMAPDGSAKVKADLTLLNTTLPANVHLLTLQPWPSSPNELLIRLENLDNPLTLHPYPDPNGYQGLVRSYRTLADYYEIDTGDHCSDRLRPRVEVDIEYLIKRIRFVALEELNLGANVRLKDDRRLNWTNEDYEAQECESSSKTTVIQLAPRQIRTFLARFEPNVGTTGAQVGNNDLNNHNESKGLENSTSGVDSDKCLLDSFGACIPN